jgi:type II secretory pathway predicted ATPase ExeA
MLLQYTPINPAALKAFGLPRSPFVDDVQSRDDVFQGPAVRYARAALLDAANNAGFIALVGESGAGKTTLLKELEQRLIDEGKDVAVIKPYVLGMEASDSKGKTLRATHIAEAIAYALDPALKIRSSPQTRFQQLHDLLKASRRAGRRHLLVIDEAHCLPLATLKHLKRFIELLDGMARLLGVALIAQPELRELLHSQNPEVREIMQRCEMIDLPPLDQDLEDYLAHKFARFDLKPGDVFEPDAYDAIRARLIRIPRGVKPGARAEGGAISTCYPLAVHNLVARAMNEAARVGYPKVDAQVIAGC